MATIKLVPSTYQLSNTSYLSITNADNMYTDTSSNTYATVTHNRASTTSYYLYIKDFNFGSIPSNAVIRSFTIRLKASETNLSTSTSYKPALYNNTTAVTGGGSCDAITTSVQTLEFTGVTATFDTIKSYGSNFGIRVTLRRSTQNTSGSVNIYGAEIEVNYVDTKYNVVSVSNTDKVDSIDPNGLTEIYEGESYTLSIYAADISDIKVEDNDNDVTSSLVRHNSVADEQTFTGIPVSFDSTNSLYATTDGDNGNGIYSTNYIENGLTDHTSSTRCALYSVHGSRAVSYMYYNFDCSSIPNNATISSVSCQFKGGSQGSTYYSAYTAQLTTGTTTKGSSTSVTGSNSSPTTVTINGGSNWTREELNNIKIKFQVTRGSSNTDTASTWSFFGATLTVTYTLPVVNPYYWTYTINSVTAAHNIVLSDSIIEIPDEDPEYNYYPITVSSINADTDPGKGTIRLVEGSNQTITIYPTDPLVTLITDNGVDVSSQLVLHSGGSPTYTVTTQVSGASYGFPLNNSTGYYTSNNNGVSSSTALCRVNFNLPVRCLVTFNYINYAEATYDFGVFSKVDTALSTTAWNSSSSGGDTTTDAGKEQIRLNTSSYNTSSVQTLTYEIPAGEHYIDIKYSKDQATDSYNDSLQWKITSIQELEANNYYTYTLSNIQTDHSLIFIFGDVTYYFVNSSGTGCRLFPNGSLVYLPGDTYSLTVVPDDYSYDITLTDNNVDVTSNVTRVEEEITKEGVTYTVVNFEYKIYNINATHNIVVTCQGAERVFIKINNAYTGVSKIYKKSGSTWSEVSADSLIGDYVYIYKETQ